MGPGRVRHVDDVTLSRLRWVLLPPHRTPFSDFCFAPAGRARRGAALAAGRPGRCDIPAWCRARRGRGPRAAADTLGRAARASGVPTPASRHAGAASPPGGAVTAAGDVAAFAPGCAAPSQSSAAWGGLALLVLRFWWGALRSACSPRRRGCALHPRCHTHDAPCRAPLRRLRRLVLKKRRRAAWFRGLVSLAPLSARLPACPPDLKPTPSRSALACRLLRVRC